VGIVKKHQKRGFQSGKFKPFVVVKEAKFIPLRFPSNHSKLILSKCKVKLFSEH